MEKTVAIRANERAYRNAKPKQLGDLHERMKFLISLLQKPGRTEEIPVEVWHAIFDLQTEVAGHKPIKPPVGRR